ncbi:MAG: NCS2 family permease [Candidatus Cryptobacteroides sp.]
MTIRKEIIGGITTFLTMSYILAVNPALLSQAGMDANALFTTTILSAIISTVVMAIYAKLPFALAPAMGANAFFVFNVVLAMGYSWQFALTAVFIEGILFILLTLTGLRDIIVESMPLELRRAISPGIGLFIAFLGLQDAGIIEANETTMVCLGNLHEPSVLLACFGILFTAVLLIRKVTGALLIGILVTTLIGIPLGITHIDSVFSAPPSIKPIFCQMEWSSIFSFDMLICVITLLFMDLFNTIGTLIGVGQRAGYVDEQGRMSGMKKAFMADAIGTTVGALLGTSTVSTYVESAAGVNAGGRSGLTAMVTALCFVLSLFFAPLFMAIPEVATAPVMILVGVMMMGDIMKIDFNNYVTAIPCFACIAFMPFAYSIPDGILMGLITWVILHLLTGNAKRLKWSTIILSMLFGLKYMFL